MSHSNYINRFIISSFGLGVSLFLTISLFSFDIKDWPNPDVIYTHGVTNLCGPIGAWLAYYCKYYLGPATFPILVSITIWFVFFCMNKKIEQLILRFIGIVLIGAALSACTWLINPGNAVSMTTGNGGILGIALGHFLLTSTAKTGAFLIMLATLIVGLLLAADNLLMLLPRFLMYGVEQLRLAGPLISSVTEKSNRIKEKAKKTGFEIFKQSASIATSSDTIALKEPDWDSDASDDFTQSRNISDYESGKVMDQDEAETFSLNDDSNNPPILINQPPQVSPAASEPATVSALAKMVSQRKRNSSKKEETTPDYSTYIYPPASLLDPPSPNSSDSIKKNVHHRAAVLQQTLKDFNLDTEVVSAETGPVITMFELKLAPGIKVSRISSLANDLARSLGAPAVRVVAPLPGKHTIGIEAPNSHKETVRIKELLRLAGDQPGRMHIPLFLGKDASGQPLIEDLTAMPHCLIAGTTGSGKSVCINSIITSILLTQRPDMVKMILIDPKMVEMNAFSNIAHLMCPIVTEMKRAEQILKWLTEKMDERYALLAEAQVRNIAGYNKLTEEELMDRFKPTNEVERMKIPMKLPYLVIIIDELADLMMTSAKEVESYIVRLAQKSRAVGIHLVLATQRPQATVVTGLIKSNMPCRISFRVASRMDSRIVLDSNGAETLLGQGDMLFLKPGTSDLLRAQGTYLSDNEINRVVKHIKEVSEPSFHPELMQLNTLENSDEPRDELFDEAVRIILTSRRGSVSLLQRRLTIGYSRASRLVDQMAMAGIVGEYKGSQARDVLMTLDEYDAIRRQMDQDAVNGYSDMQNPEDELYTDTTPLECLVEDEPANNPITVSESGSTQKDSVPVAPHIPPVDDMDDLSSSTIITSHANKSPEFDLEDNQDMEDVMVEEDEDGEAGDAYDSVGEQMVDDDREEEWEQEELADSDSQINDDFEVSEDEEIDNVQYEYLDDDEIT